MDEVPVGMGAGEEPLNDKWDDPVPMKKNKPKRKKKDLEKKKKNLERRKKYDPRRAIEKEKQKKKKSKVSLEFLEFWIFDEF